MNTQISYIGQKDGHTGHDMTNTRMKIKYLV